MTDTDDEVGRDHGQGGTISPELMRWFFLGLVIIAIFVFFAFFAPRFGAASLEIDLKGQKVAINTKQITVPAEEARRLSREEYYVDSHRGFSFKKLTPQWVPQACKGIEEILTLRGVVLTEDFRKTLMLSLRAHPFGPMLREVEVVRFAAGDPLQVEITDESTNQVIEETVENILKSKEFQESKPNAGQIAEFRKDAVRSSIGFDKIQFRNEFTVYCYDKSRLSAVPVKHSIANFAISSLGAFGLLLDQLAADTKSILAGGSVRISNVMVNGRKQDFRVDRLWLYTENRQYYYLVEIGFSPQTQSSMQVWAELERALKSFSVTT